MVKFVDESFTAFGSPREWEVLMEKDREQYGPSIVAKIDNYFKPAPEDTMVQPEQPKTISFDIGDTNFGRPEGIAAEKAKLIKSVSSEMINHAKTLVSNLTPSLGETVSKVPSQIEWAFSEARKANPSSSLNLVKQPLSDLIKVRKDSNNAYNIFNDPKYFPYKPEDFDIDRITGRTIPTILGLRKPGQDFDKDLDKV
jgi:hypothetical protein